MRCANERDGSVSDNSCRGCNVDSQISIFLVCVVDGCIEVAAAVQFAFPESRDSLNDSRSVIAVILVVELRENDKHKSSESRHMQIFIGVFRTVRASALGLSY